MEKNKLMLIIIIVLLVILLGTMGFGAYYVVSSFNSMGEEQSQEAEEEEEDSDKSLNTIIDVGDPVYTNLLVGEDKKEHIARVSLSIDVKGGEDDSEAVINALNTRIVVVRDIVNGILRRKTVEELKKVDGWDNFKDEVLDKIRKEFNSNSILNVYIKDVALQ